MYACMYVCMHVCMHVCMYLCMHVSEAVDISSKLVLPMCFCLINDVDNVKMYSYELNCILICMVILSCGGPNEKQFCTDLVFYTQ